MCPDKSDEAGPTGTQSEVRYLNHGKMRNAAIDVNPLWINLWDFSRRTNLAPYDLV